ncbi:glycoside hydrolase family 38 N-terminal domain-containing protein [Diplocloster agilis]|uniref:Glycoside hydrolase family 38 N-terminal domain-containing protein n=1 Tax=Diplocloster agilis TaxID=2850323 RepID=A0A949JW06_9FIRM|nr:hypothetical protein [Diplocloster agilis]MBU9736190.1 hypothetical protein [Diplocloster agilis]
MSIQKIDLIHHSHTDFGFTDHPMYARRLQKEYVDQALQLAMEDPDFYWTAETALPVADWWQSAEERERSLLITALQAGKLDICGMAFNTTAFHTPEEWDRIVKWLPRELTKQWKPCSIMQNDVNGMPRAALMRALDQGMNALWIGPNTYNALPPCPTPSAFYWEMPDGRKMFVWLNSGYCDGYFLFNENWRIGPVPAASDLCYRPPGPGDIWKADEESVLSAHRRCLETIKLLEGNSGDNLEQSRDGFTQNKIYGGYPYERLLVSVTNNYRIDNDPPFGPIADFVRKWRELGLKPEIRMTTATEAMHRMEEENKDRIPVKKGEWVDWWANGTVSAPVELAAGKRAAVNLKAAAMLAENRMETRRNAGEPDTAGMSKRQRADYEDALKQLCMFHEHTYGSWQSVAAPFSIDARMMAAEKNVFAYRALALSENLTAELLRGGKTTGELCLINPGKYPASTWVRFPYHCLRGDYCAVEDLISHKRYPLLMEEGPSNFKRPEAESHLSRENVSKTFSDCVPEQIARFWADNLQPFEARGYRLLSENQGDAGCGKDTEPSLDIELNQRGWPGRVCRKGAVVLDGEFGAFLSCRPKGFAPRWVLKDIFLEEDEKRARMREESLEIIAAKTENAVKTEENEYTVTYRQEFSHPSLEWGRRELILYKKENRARLHVKINRKSSFDPEVFYLAFQSPVHTVPLFSNADLPYIPGEGQLPGSCMDYYATDGFAWYEQGERSWLWNGMDTSLTALGEPHVSERAAKMPEHPDRLLSMIFDNTWDTNFAANSCGIMEFSYEVLADGGFRREELPDVAQALNKEPILIINT